MKIRNGKNEQACSDLELLSRKIKATSLSLESRLKNVEKMHMEEREIWKKEKIGMGKKIKDLDKMIEQTKLSERKLNFKLKTEKEENTALKEKLKEMEGKYNAKCEELSQKEVEDFDKDDSAYVSQLAEIEDVNEPNV